MKKEDVDFSSAKMWVDTQGSAVCTGISSDGQWSALHLTRNADRVIDGDKRASDSDISAININGSVEVHLRPTESPSGWDFHFIQLVALMNSYTNYLGRVSEEGFMTVNLAAPPAFKEKFAYDFVLDSLDGLMPFMNLRAPVIFPKLDGKGHPVSGRSSIVTDMDDHPAARMRLAFKNHETNCANFLAEAHDQRLFVTTFVARDARSKVIIPLAYVTWQIEWKAKYRWLQGRCVPYDVGGSFNVDNPVIGPPKANADILGRTGSSVASKITTPTTDPSETGNALVNAAAATLDHQPKFWNLHYYKQWSPNAPMRFWTP